MNSEIQKEKAESRKWGVDVWDWELDLWDWELRIEIRELKIAGGRNLYADRRSHNDSAQAQILTNFPFTVCSDRKNIFTGGQGCVSIAWCMREGDSDRLVEYGPMTKTGAPSAQSSHLESSVLSSAALIARQQIGWQPWRLTFSDPKADRSAVRAGQQVRRRHSCRRVTIPSNIQTLVRG